MAGAQESRLITALDGVAPGTAWNAATEWRRCAATLDQVAERLSTCSLGISEGDAGWQTANAMDGAFAKSAEALKKRATALRAGGAALRATGDQMHDSRTAYEALGGAPSAPADFKPVDDDPSSDASIKARKDHDAKVADYNSAMQHRETVSQKEADKLDAVFQDSSATMKEIHGEPDPEQPKGPTDGGDGPGGRTPASPHSPTHNNGGGNDDGGKDKGGKDDGGKDDGGKDDGGNGDDGNGTDDPPPTTIIDWLHDPDSPEVPTTDGGGGGLTSVGGAVGAGATVAGGGIAAAALSGGLRGVLGGQAVPASAASAAPGAASAAGRPIGAGGRVSTGGVLGRSGTSATGTSGASGTAGRSGAGAGTAGRGGSGSRGAGAKSGAGSRGAAGRGGAGAAGRGKGNKDDERGKAHELFDVDEDWTGDEDGAPPVLQ